MRRHLRINCLLIVLLALLLAVAGSVGAYYLSDRLSRSATWYGAGTEEDPYRIYDASQLYSLQELSSSPAASTYTKGKYFVLKNDVELSTKAKASRYGFEGVFDGDGHTVRLKQGELFYRLSGKAQVKGLTVRFSFSVSRTSREVCAVARVVGANALIENCTAEGDITIAPNFSSTGSLVIAYQVYCAPFTASNHGTIRNCTFRGSITGDDSAITSPYAHLYVGGIAAYGEGTVENCEVHATIDLKPGAVVGLIAGITPQGTAVGCKFFGDIKLGCDPAHTWSKASVHRATIYGLARSVTEGYFEGDIVLDKDSEPNTVPVIGGEGSTFVFEGRVCKRTESGDLVDWPPEEK